MSMSNSRQSYIDCYEVLDKALEDHEGVRVKVDSYEEANRYRLRLHMARSINRKDNQATYEPGDPMYNSSIYDKLVVRLKIVADQWWVYLEHWANEVGEVQRLSEVEDIALPPPSIQPMLTPPEPVKQIEYIRRRV